MIKYPLVGYDGSDTARRAFRFALDMARSNAGRVRVVSVMQVAESGADVCALMMTADTGPERLQALLDELTAMAPEAAGLIDVELTRGSPGDVLLDQIRQHHIDHLVIGHTARGTLARWLLGSVSAQVLARSPVPVTIVP